jgi:hypothetical protein
MNVYFLIKKNLIIFISTSIAYFIFYFYVYLFIFHVVDLSKISGNVKFLEVSYKELKDLEKRINETSTYACLSKPFIFIEPPIIDEFVFSYVNENITGSEFTEKFNSLLNNVYFEQLNVKHLVVNNLTTKTINNINVEEFKSQIITKNGYQNITGNITIKHLEVEKLYFDFINGRPSSDLKKIVDKVNNFYDDVFNGKILVNSLNVTKNIKTSKINSFDLNKELNIHNIKEFVFSTNMTIENIVVDGLVNNLNFTEKVQDSVLKTDKNVTITGTKIIKKLNCKNLQVEYINEHSVDDIITADKVQILTGPVKVIGMSFIFFIFYSDFK